MRTATAWAVIAALVIGAAPWSSAWAQASEKKPAAMPGPVTLASAQDNTPPAGSGHVWFLMWGWGAVMKPYRPEPFRTWRECHDYQMSVIAQGRGGWSLHCEETP